MNTEGKQKKENRGIIRGILSVQLNHRSHYHGYVGNKDIRLGKDRLGVVRSWESESVVNWIAVLWPWETHRRV